MSVPENNQIDGWLDKLIPMKNAWSRGIPILALGQASAILGSYYPGAENGSVMEPGLDLLNAIFIPGSGYSNDWQQLFQAATSQPKIVSFLIPKDASIIVDPQVSRVSGEDAIVSLDLRNSTAASSDNRRSGFANGLLDVFAPGDIIQPQFADINMIPLRAATPNIPTPT